MKKLSPKQPDEKYRIKFEFAEDYEMFLDTINAITATVIDLVDGSDVSATLLDSSKDVISGTNAYVWVQDGEDAHTYKITVVATGDAFDEVYELDAKLPVRAI